MELRRSVAQHAANVRVAQPAIDTKFPHGLQRFNRIRTSPLRRLFEFGEGDLAANASIDTDGRGHKTQFKVMEEMEAPAGKLEIGVPSRLRISTVPAAA